MKEDNKNTTPADPFVSETAAFVDDFAKDFPDKCLLRPIGLILSDYMFSFIERNKNEADGVSSSAANLLFPPYFKKYGERLVNSMRVLH